MAQRIVFLTINTPNVAKNQNLVIVNGPIETPYAQVIVLDARFGDSNVIDLCRVPIEASTGDYADTNTPDPTYYRAIVDTGPYSDQLTNLVRVLKTFGQPKLYVTQSGQTYEPAGYDEAAISMFQVTHMDEDHGGQAVQLLSQVRTDPVLGQSWVNTDVLYHEPPKLNADFKVKIDSNYQVSAGQPMQFECIVENPDGWLEKLENADFRLQYHFRWQSLDTADDASSDTDWKDIGKERKSSVLVEIKLGDIWDNVNNDYPKYMVIQCGVKLQIFGKGHSTIMGKKGNLLKAITSRWQPVQVQRATGGKDSNNNPIFEYRDVEWRASSVYAVKPVSKNNMSSYLVFTPESTKMVHKGPLMRGVTIFQEMDSAVKMMESTWKALKGVSQPVEQWVNPVVPLPIQGMYSQYIGQPWQCAVVGPTSEIYDELIRAMVTARYKTATTIVDSATGKGDLYGPYQLKAKPDTDMKDMLDSDMDIENRASIVTLFRRFKLDNVGDRIAWQDPEFQMLFTGDAYDRECQISSTVAAFNYRNLTQYVDVLKVPHHCSIRTSDSHFYKFFRAKVYLICAQQSEHGNPSITGLNTIAEGFKQTVAEYLATQGDPWLLFFSDPGCLDNIQNEKSHVWSLLNTSRYRPFTDTSNPNNTIYNYRCFRLRQGASTGMKNGKPVYARTAGRIIFGRGANGLATQFTVSNNPTNLADADYNDWVEIKAD